jgi:O-antigen/teichoic acid export membrane protein
MFLLYYKAKKKIFMLSLISVGISVIVNIVMVKNFQIIGDALASMINTCIFCLLVSLFIKNLVIEKFDKKKPVLANQPNN